MAAGRGDRDPLRFWLSVLAALRQTAAGSALVRAVTAAPDLDGWVITERLLADLAPLDDPLWLVVDDGTSDGTIIRLNVDEPWQFAGNTEDLESAWLPVLSGLVRHLERGPSSPSDKAK